MGVKSKAMSTYAPGSASPMALMAAVKLGVPVLAMALASLSGCWPHWVSVARMLLMVSSGALEAAVLSVIRMFTTISSEALFMAGAMPVLVMVKED